MSVKINGIKKLNANAYNKIVIREVDSNYFVNVTGEKLSDKYVSISSKLFDNLKKIDDNEKIISIVDSILENMKIDSIDMFVLCIGYKGEFIKIDGTRKLYLQIENKVLLKEIIKMIKAKYNRDRYQYCINNSMVNSYNIILDDKISSYNKHFISCYDCSGCDVSENCPKYIEFKMIYNGNQLVNFDKLFIERFILDKLWEVGKEACIFIKEKDIKLKGGEKVGGYVDAYYILCGDLSIRFSCSVLNRDYIFTLCSEIINRYNNELNVNNDIKRKQLKMEGF